MEETAPYIIDRGTVESIGSLPLFAAIDGAAIGISYRHWLIGQALTGITADPQMEEAERAARFAVLCADAVIAALDAEAAKDTKTADLFEAGHQCCGRCK